MDYIIGMSWNHETKQSGIGNFWAQYWIFFFFKVRLEYNMSWQT